MEEQNVLKFLKGVGPRRVLALEKMGILDVEDLLYYFPRSYEDRRQVTPLSELSYVFQQQEDVLVRGKIFKIKEKRSRQGRSLLYVFIEDDTDCLEIMFFNPRFLKKKFTVGQEAYFFGKNSPSSPQVMLHPEFFFENDNPEPWQPFFANCAKISLSRRDFSIAFTATFI